MIADANREKALFVEALEQDDPGQWPAFLDRACAGDPGLRRRVEALLEAHAKLSTAPGSARPGEPAPLAIDGYEILGELGRGGMGVVFKARHTQLDRVVALKMILPGHLPGAAERDRFRTEARTLAGLQHPHIVQIFDVGEHGGQPFLELEYCPGGGLDRVLAGKPLPPQEAARLVQTLARAVQAAHEVKVIHRDLKPANVLLAADNTPRITDFGLAKKLGDDPRTPSGAILGTPSYMAPEQAKGKKEVGPAADIHALGAILYECLTGQPPFKAATLHETLLRVVADEPVPPRQLQRQTPRDLETICLKCLQKEPARRYATAQELADDLGRYLAGEPIQARPMGVAERVVRWVRRRPMVTALVVIASAVTLWAVLGYLADPERVRERARRDHARGLPVTLVRDTGPPIGYAWAEGEALTKAFSEQDEPFLVSTRSTALIELWRQPLRAYRFRAQIRHEENTSAGEVGLYVEYRRPDSLIPWPCCYVVRFADRGSNATAFRGPDGRAGSKVRVGFHYFRPVPAPQPREGTITFSDDLFFVPPPLSPAPGPWRTIEVGVSADGIEAFWTNDEGEVKRVARLTRGGELDSLPYLLKPKVNAPAMGGYAFNPSERAAVGLYVRNSAASFRNVVLAPFEAER
jgi:hypothetical protein